jgi:hypothetical protein
MLFVLVASLAAQDIDSLPDRILRMSEDLLAGYAQPLVNVFGTGISTGLFYSAYSHDFLGFDLGLRLLYINVPQSAKYFTGTALICSLVVDSAIHVVQYEVELESLSTVFGPDNETVVPIQGNSVAIPPKILGGFNLDGIPMFSPQLNVGLGFGSQIAIRYVPFTFRSTKFRFFGIGFKQEITKLPPLSLAQLPFAIAFAGAYQKFTIASSSQDAIIDTETKNFQAIVSARIGPFEPMVAFGLENTTADFEYTFEYEVPDTIMGIPFETPDIQENISVRLEMPNHYRTVVGLTLRTGLIFVHYDYNITPYSTHNLTLGFTWR